MQPQEKQLITMSTKPRAIDNKDFLINFFFYSSLEYTKQYGKKID